MARISGRESMKAYIKKYASNGLDFLTLKDDGDTAHVVFLHTDDTDLELHLVHKVEVDGKERFVECLEDGCPLCEAIGRPTLKLFMVAYDLTDDKVKVWERGSTMVDFFIGFIDKYGNLNNRPYEIVRHGKKNSTKTQYQLFAEDKLEVIDAEKHLFSYEIPDPKDARSKIQVKIEIPERPEILGKFILDYTADQMKELCAVPQQRDRSASTTGANDGTGTNKNLDF